MLPVCYAYKCPYALILGQPASRGEHGAGHVAIRTRHRSLPAGAGGASCVVQQCDDRSAAFGARLTVRSTVSKLSSRGDTCAHVQRARRGDRLVLLLRHWNCCTGEHPAYRHAEHPVRPEEGRCSLLPYPFAVIGFLS
jgi:hypothetical protein